IVGCAGGCRPPAVRGRGCGTAPPLVNAPAYADKTGFSQAGSTDGHILRIRRQWLADKLGPVRTFRDAGLQDIPFPRKGIGLSIGAGPHPRPPPGPVRSWNGVNSVIIRRRLHRQAYFVYGGQRSALSEGPV